MQYQVDGASASFMFCYATLDFVVHDMRMRLPEFCQAFLCSSVSCRFAAVVPVRTLQQYDHRQKDISHTCADYVLSFARMPACDPHDILERDACLMYKYVVVAIARPKE